MLSEVLIVILLDIVWFDQGELKLNFEFINICELCGLIVDEMMMWVKEKGIVLKIWLFDYWVYVDKIFLY